MGPGTEIDQRSVRVRAAVRRDEKLIVRAAQHADWAAAALKTAARDLTAAHGDDGNPLTGLAEIVLEQAARTTSLAEDIAMRRPAGTPAIACSALTRPQGGARP